MTPGDAEGAADRRLLWGCLLFGASIIILPPLGRRRLEGRPSPLLVIPADHPLGIVGTLLLLSSTLPLISIITIATTSTDAMIPSAYLHAPPQESHNRPGSPVLPKGFRDDPLARRDIVVGGSGGFHGCFGCGAGSARRGTNLGGRRSCGCGAGGRGRSATSTTSTSTRGRSSSRGSRTAGSTGGRRPRQAGDEGERHGRLQMRGGGGGRLLLCRHGGRICVE